MINENFVDTCLKVCTATDGNYKYSIDLFESINKIFNWCDKQFQTDDKQFNFKEKYGLAKYLTTCRIKMGEKFNINKAIEVISLGKYNSYVPLLQQIDKEMDETEVDEFLLETVIPKRQICDLVNDDKKLKNLLDKIEFGDFEDNNELIKEWKDIITKYHEDIVSIDRIQAINSAESLNLLNDDYAPVIDKYKNSTNSEDVIKTGFDLIDKSLPRKGLEKRRIYIFAGSTGVGKSIALGQILYNTMKHKSNINKPSEKKQTHVFITCENLIDESLIRFYCTSTGEPQSDVVERLHTDPNFDIKKPIKELLENSNSNVLFYYVPAMLTTVKDIEAILNKVSQQHNVASLFVDYIDLIRSNKVSDNRYEELGEVTLAFKRIAVLYDIPVITVTQLNRSGYNNNKPTITSIGDSLKKATDSDFLCFLQNEEEDELHKFIDSDGNEIQGSKVKMTILKNRNGATNQSTTLFLRKKMGDQDIFSFRFEPMPQISDNSTSDSYDDEY